MHPNPAFRGETADRNLAFARARSFGTLAVNAKPAPLLSHVPFLLSEDAGFAELHLVRSNPIARLGETDAVIAVSGPDGYISPDWYGVQDQVPTWNYVAVHLRGRLVPMPHDDLPPLLDRLSQNFESRLAPKAPWTSAKMTPDALNRMLRQILPFRFDIHSVDGTWKLGQNKPDAARLGAADNLESGTGSELSALARLMQAPDKD